MTSVILAIHGAKCSSDGIVPIPVNPFDAARSLDKLAWRAGLTMERLKESEWKRFHRAPVIDACGFRINPCRSGTNSALLLFWARVLRKAAGA